MKIIIKSLIAQVLLTIGAAAYAADYTGMAMDLARTARENGVSRVLLGSFSAAAGSESEAAYAQEKAAAGLATQKDLELIDQEAVQAFAGSKEGWMKRLPAKSRPQAFVKGSVFQEGDSVTVMIKLVDARNGRVLSAMELKSAARFSSVSSLPGMEMPELNWKDLPPLPEAPKDLRDALNDDSGCSASFRQMDRLNGSAVDLKARYWAAKMKQPGFAMGTLTRNPGSEIRDPQLKQKFYELLAKYHEQDEAPALGSAQARQLEDFMAKERSVIDRCGIK